MRPLVMVRVVMLFACCTYFAKRRVPNIGSIPTNMVRTIRGALAENADHFTEGFERGSSRKRLRGECLSRCGRIWKAFDRNVLKCAVRMPPELIENFQWLAPHKNARRATLFRHVRISGRRKLLL